MILAAIKGKRLAPGVAYLSIPNILTAKSDSSLSLADILKAFQCVAANVTKKAAEEYVALLKSGKAKDQAMETCSQSRFIAAKMHTLGYIFGMFKEAVEEMDDSNETKVLATVCRLYGLWVIDEQAGHFLKCECLGLPNGVVLIVDGYFSPDQIDKVQVSVDQLCAEVRAYAGTLKISGPCSMHHADYLVPLVDSFALSDHIINSPLGKWDGSIYESYFAQVRASNPTPKEHPYFNRLIKPLLERQNATHNDAEGDMGLDEELREMEEERKEAAASAKAAREAKFRRED